MINFRVSSTLKTNDYVHAANDDPGAKSEGDISEVEIVKMYEDLLERHDGRESAPRRSPDVPVALPNRDMVV